MNRKKETTPWTMIAVVAALLIAGFIYFKSKKPCDTQELAISMQEPAIACDSCAQPATTTEPKAAVCEICNPNDFANLKDSENPVVIKFYATWCGPCNNLAPVFEKVAEKYRGKIDFYSANIDKKELVEAAQNAGIAKEAIVYLPTIIFYKKGAAHEQITGGLSEGDLQEKVESILLR